MRSSFTLMLKNTGDYKAGRVLVPGSAIVSQLFSSPKVKSLAFTRSIEFKFCALPARPIPPNVYSKLPWRQLELFYLACFSFGPSIHLSALMQYTDVSTLKLEPPMTKIKRSSKLTRLGHWRLCSASGSVEHTGKESLLLRLENLYQENSPFL